MVRSRFLKGWFRVPRKSTECSAEYIYYTRGNVTHKLLFYADNTWAGFARNVQITTELLGDVASKPVTHNDYRNISEAVRKYQLCSGNTDLDAAASCTVIVKDYVIKQFVAKCVPTSGRLCY